MKMMIGVGLRAVSVRLGVQRPCPVPEAEPSQKMWSWADLTSGEKVRQNCPRQLLLPIAKH